jgi:hypothetical protein
MNFLPVFLLLVTSITIVLCQNPDEFNAFKSYRSEKIKPPQYGRKEKRNHPIHEYLSGPQKKMLKHRTGRIAHPDAVFRKDWSGFDKGRRFLLMEVIGTKEDPPVSNFEYIRWVLLSAVVLSVGWLFYLLVQRQTMVRKNSIPSKLSEEKGQVENLEEA